MPDGNDLLADLLNDDKRSKEQRAVDDRLLQLRQEALKAVLLTRNGRRLLWMLMGECGLTQNPFTGDRNTTDFNCGRVSVGAGLLVDINAVDPDAYSLMAREAREDSKQ